MNHGLEGPASRESPFAHETGAQEKIGHRFSSDFETLEEDDEEMEVVLCADGAADTRVTGISQYGIDQQDIEELVYDTSLEDDDPQILDISLLDGTGSSGDEPELEQLFKRGRSMFSSRTDQVFELERCQQCLDRDGC